MDVASSYVLRQHSLFLFISVSGCLVVLVSGLSLVPHDFVVSVELQQSLCWGFVGDVLRENLGFSWGGF